MSDEVPEEYEDAEGEHDHEEAVEAVGGVGDEAAHEPDLFTADNPEDLADVEIPLVPEIPVVDVDPAIAAGYSPDVDVAEKSFEDPPGAEFIKTLPRKYHLPDGGTITFYRSG